MEPEREPATLVDVLSVADGADLEFDPDRLGLTPRLPDL